MPLSTKVHHYQRIPGTTMARLVKVTPYIRLSHATVDEKGGTQATPPVFLQDGQAWSEGGDAPIPTHELPAWVSEALGRLTVQARQEVGWRLPEDPPLPAKPEPALVPSGPRRGPRLGRPRTQEG